MKVLTDVMRDALMLRLRLAAKDDGMSDLSKKTGIAREHLYKILSDEGNPTLDSLIKIAAALKMQLELKDYPANS